MALCVARAHARAWSRAFRVPAGRFPSCRCLATTRRDATKNASRFEDKLLQEEHLLRENPQRRRREQQGDASGNALAPTFVERQEGVHDGQWTRTDAQLVEQALSDRGTGRATLRPLLGAPLTELQVLFKELGHPSYRAKQIQDGLLHGVEDLQSMSQLPKPLRESLAAAGLTLGRTHVHHVAKSMDGTHKLLLRLADARIVEAVGIPADRASKQRLTACVSSQVGCPMRCRFCATGQGGFARNLEVHEIVDQVLRVQEVCGQRVSHVVFMGMGEPLLNVDNVLAAMAAIREHIGIGGRNLTISTVGVRRKIRQLAEQKLQSTLAVSLHAPNQQLREQLIPSARVYPLDELMRDCKAYFQMTSRRVTLEYTLLHGVNDSPEQAEELCKLMEEYRMAAHVNVIAWNAVEGIGYRTPPPRAVSKFVQVLEKNDVGVTVREPRGLDVAAACGQLRNKFQKDAMPMEAQALPVE